MAKPPNRRTEIERECRRREEEGMPIVERLLAERSITERQRIIETLTPNQIRGALGASCFMRSNALWSRARRESGDLHEFCDMVNRANASIALPEGVSEVPGFERPKVELAPGQISDQPVLSADAEFRNAEEVWRQLCLAWNQTDIMHPHGKALDQFVRELAGHVAQWMAEETVGDAVKIFNGLLQRRYVTKTKDSS